MTWLASWLLKGWLSRWAVTAEGEIKDGWRWLTASATHALIAALLLSLAVNGCQWHRASAWPAKLHEAEARGVATARKALDAFHREQAAFDAQSRTVEVLTIALRRQNAAVRALATAGARAHDQQQDALAGVAGERRSRAASAARQQADAAGAVDGPDCRTPASVMADKGKL